MTKKTKEVAKDKRTTDQNSKAKPINYPKVEKKKSRQTASNPSGGDIAPVIKKESALIEYRFSQDEINDKSKRLALACQDIASIEDEKRQMTTSFKFKIDGKQSEINILSNEIANGYEMKTVTCDVHRNFTTGKREYWHEGKMYHTESLTAQDHQIELDLAEENNSDDSEELSKYKKKVKGEAAAPIEKPFDLKLAAGDFVVTKKGTTIEITDEDILNGVRTASIERLATNEEIETFNKNK